MDGHTPILEFKAARVGLEPGGGPSAPITLSLPPGGLLAADLRGPRRRRAFAEAAIGLRAPAEGTIRFQGRDWHEVSPEHAAAMRGRIGHLFAHDAWLPEFSVEENILLAPLYHTSRPERALREEAARLAAAFGLPGLPTGEARLLPRGDRHRAGLVRAFLNEPALVVLEEPMGNEEAELMPALMAAIREVRDRGGAVLWLTQDIAWAVDRALPATQRVRLSHGVLVPLGEKWA